MAVQMLLEQKHLPSVGEEQRTGSLPNATEKHDWVGGSVVLHDTPITQSV
jgi:hypothetical protein